MQPAGDCDAVFSYPMFRDLEKAPTAFSGIAGHVMLDANVAYRGQTFNGDGMLVSGSYFPVLGLRPALGRLLGPEDDAPIGGNSVVGAQLCVLGRPDSGRARQCSTIRSSSMELDDDRRRGAARLRRHDARRRARAVRPDHDARAVGARLARASTTAAATGCTCSRG